MTPDNNTGIISLLGLHVGKKTMRATQFFIPTQKEIPADAEIISHKLMLRAGMIRRLASGVYTWMPLGLRVLRKVEAIVREEMDKIGALELLLPQVIPAELWEETGRWETFGSELLKIVDRHERQYCFGPTHEEAITDMARDLLKSYKQLPIVFYQIQNKFRDEIRPRFGVMRAREFLMKDAYSFHMTDESLDQAYQTMFEAYTTIFTRLGLLFRPVLADTGSIGGSTSHEFHVLADSGEDLLAFSDDDSSNYAANVERAEAFSPDLTQRPEPSEPMKRVDTPGQYTIEAVTKLLGVNPRESVKTLMVKGNDEKIVALILRGDHDLNPLKAEKLEQIASPLTFASEAEILKVAGCKPGSLGPVGLNDVDIFVDRDAAMLSDFVCGANQDDKHYTHVNWQRDVTLPTVCDLREVIAGDKSPDGKGFLQFKRGIEVGHIFQLGSKYSDAMKASVLDEAGKACTLKMGCYGIGISRIVAAAIEQNHDDSGIVWPQAMAPFQIVIVPINLHKSYRLREICEQIYCELIAEGYEVLLDDRKERPGVLFADHDLLGIPHRLVLSEKNLDANIIEYKKRTESEAKTLPLNMYLTEIKRAVI